MLEVGPVPRYFGEWTDKDSDNNTLVINEVYKVGSDGFVTAWATPTTTLQYIKVLTDSVNPPTTVRSGGSVQDCGNYTTQVISGNTWVKRGDYFKVISTAGGAKNISWLPICNGLCVKQV